MNVKKLRIILIIVVSSIFLLLYVFVLRGYREHVWLHIVMGNDGVEDVVLLKQRHPFGENPVLQDAENTTLAISWQENYTREGKGLFLPAYIDLTDVYAYVSGEAVGSEITFDSVPLQKTEVCRLGNVEEGVHMLGIGGEALQLYIGKSSSLPSVWIDTEEGIDFINGHKQYATAARMQIFSEKGSLEYSGEIESLKGRGNSSWSTLKKGYGIKLAEKYPLLGMTSGKSWTLIGGGYDVTGIRNKLFYDMAVECGLENAIDCQWINLYMDGSFLGCYLLTEKITVGAGRLEIGDLEERTALENEEGLWTYPHFQMEEGGRQWTGYSVPSQPGNMSGGYLLEIETYEQRFLTEVSRFTTDVGTRVVLKNPKHATLEQVQYISSFVREFEEALYSADGYNSQGKYYLEYIDLESFVKRYLIDEISKNLDAGYSSYFFYKPENVDKLYAGPVWDYDTSLGNNRDWGSNEVLKNPQGMYVNTDNWSRLLWEKKDFREASYEMYQKLFLPYLEELLTYKLDGYAEDIRASAALEQIYYGGENWEEETQKLKEFLEKRTDYLKKAFQ